MRIIDVIADLAKMNASRNLTTPEFLWRREIVAFLEEKGVS